MICARLATLFSALLATANFVDARNSHRGGTHVRRGTFYVDTPTSLSAVRTFLIVSAPLPV